jgi:hypothetical protein
MVKKDKSLDRKKVIRKVVLASLTDKHFQYCCYWNKKDNLSVLIVDPESNESRDVIFLSDKHYYLGGAFYSDGLVESLDLMNPISGRKDLEDFERKYNGEFKVPTFVGLEDYFKLNPQVN